jgi:PTH1 family peptidyl-tRNA hydrolase
MFTIVGLGNPGREYAQTRHNIGFVIADRVADTLSLSWQNKPKFQAEVAKNDQVALIKPQSYMNNSGLVTRKVLDYFQEKNLDQLYVIHDDLDLPVGSVKTQFGKGPHGHNGLLSLYQHLGTKEFWHIRVGVDGRNGQRVIPPDQYVLQTFLPEEQTTLQPVVEQVTKSLLQLLHAPI